MGSGGGGVIMLCPFAGGVGRIREQMLHRAGNLGGRAKICNRSIILLVVLRARARSQCRCIRARAVVVVADRSGTTTLEGGD